VYSAPETMALLQVWELDSAWGLELGSDQLESALSEWRWGSDWEREQSQASVKPWELA